MVTKACLRRTAFLFFAALWSLPAQADPIVFFLMSVAREMVTTAMMKPSPPVVVPLPEAPGTYSGTAVRPDDLRRIVDESFVYLSSSQRAEVFDSLHAKLLDPNLGISRATLIEYFVHKALAVRLAQLQMARLSQADKLELASQFRQEIAGLPDDERRQLLLVLEKNLLPVPADLNRLLLAELQAVR